MDHPCADCDRLWREFSRANDELLKVIERKVAGSSGDDLEKKIAAAIEVRRAARQRVVEHDQGHASEESVPI